MNDDDDDNNGEKTCLKNPYDTRYFHQKMHWLPIIKTFYITLSMFGRQYSSPIVILYIYDLETRCTERASSYGHSKHNRNS